MLLTNAVSICIYNPRQFVSTIHDNLYPQSKSICIHNPRQFVSTIHVNLYLQSTSICIYNPRQFVSTIHVILYLQSTSVCFYNPRQFVSTIHVNLYLQSTSICIYNPRQFVSTIHVNLYLQSKTISFKFHMCSYPISLKNASKVLEVVRLWNEFWAKIWILKSWWIALRAIVRYGPGPRVITSPTKSPQDGIRYTDPLHCVVCISLQLKSAWFQSRLFAVGTPNLTSHRACTRNFTAEEDLTLLCSYADLAPLSGQWLPSPTQYCSTEDGVEWNGKSVSASALNILAATLLRWAGLWPN